MTATAPAAATESAAELPKLTPLHIEKITKLEDLAKVIAKLNAQTPAGMQVQFIAKADNAAELTLASEFILNMPTDLRKSVELLKKLLSGDPRKMTEDSFNKLLEKEKLDSSNMNNLIVSKSRTVDLSEKSGDALSLPAEIGGPPTALSTDLTALLKESLEYKNPPLVVVRAPNAEAGDPFLQSLGRWCKMHQDKEFKDLTQDAFNLLRATKDDLNPINASYATLLPMGQLIKLAEAPVEGTPAPPGPAPTSFKTPPSIDIGARELTMDERILQQRMQALAESFFKESEKPSPDQNELDKIAKEIADIIGKGNGQALQDIFLKGKKLKESHKLVLAEYNPANSRISVVDFCDNNFKEEVTWNEKTDAFLKIDVDADKKLGIGTRAEKKTWTLPAVLIMKSDGDQRSFAHINEMPRD